MIEPFEAGQVKQVNGNRIVSYGTSSYGYDVRCAREFKVFTNINSTIVDPKHFDNGSFVDITADECIIPPELVRAGAHRWSISASRATCWWSASARAPTRAAESS